MAACRRGGRAGGGLQQQGAHDKPKATRAPHRGCPRSHLELRPRALSARRRLHAGRPLGAELFGGEAPGRSSSVRSGQDQPDPDDLVRPGPLLHPGRHRKRPRTLRGNRHRSGGYRRLPGQSGSDHGGALQAGRLRLSRARRQPPVLPWEEARSGWTTPDSTRCSRREPTTTWR